MVAALGGGGVGTEAEALEAGAPAGANGCAVPAVAVIGGEVGAEPVAVGQPGRAGADAGEATHAGIGTGVSAGPAAARVGGQVDAPVVAHCERRDADASGRVRALESGPADGVGWAGDPASAAVMRIPRQVDAGAVTIGQGQVAEPWIAGRADADSGLAGLSTGANVAAASAVLGVDEVLHAAAIAADRPGRARVAAHSAVVPVVAEVDARPAAAVAAGPYAATLHPFSGGDAVAVVLVAARLVAVPLAVQIARLAVDTAVVPPHRCRWTQPPQAGRWGADVPRDRGVAGHLGAAPDRGAVQGRGRGRTGSPSAGRTAPEGPIGGRTDRRPAGRAPGRPGRGHGAPSVPSGSSRAARTREGTHQALPSRPLAAGTGRWRTHPPSDVVGAAPMF